MKILQVNKFYYPKGGSESHFIGLVKLLRKNQQQVIVFSTQNEKNIAGEEKDVFIEEIEMKLSNFKRGLNLFYNRTAILALEKIIKQNRPDVVHLHNISHHFSPAILRVFKKHKLPVVMTVHDYKLICPNYKLFNKGEVCQKCRGGKYYQCALNRCVKTSFLASLIMALEAYWAKSRKYYQAIDRLIVPSRFMQNKLREFGWSINKLTYIPNFLANNSESIDVSTQKDERYLLFFGRLSEEKGLVSLIKNFRNIEDKTVNLKIVGEGPLLEELKKLVLSLDLAPRVHFLGYQKGRALQGIIAKAVAVVVPSKWYENAPYVILEAYAHKKTVIGASMGGIPEMIKAGETGAVYDFKNENNFKKVVDDLLKDPEKIEMMGKKGNDFLIQEFNEAKYLRKLLKTYKQVIKQNSFK